MGIQTSGLRLVTLGVFALEISNLTGCGLTSARRHLDCAESSDPALAALCKRIVPELSLDTVWRGRCGIPSFSWAYWCNEETVAKIVCSGTFGAADSKVATDALPQTADSASYACLNRLSATWEAYARGEGSDSLDPDSREVARKCPRRSGQRAASSGPASSR